MEELESPPAEGRVTFPERDEALHPPEERCGVVLLSLDVDGLVVVLGVDDDREVEPLGVGAREARVAVGAPLERGTDAVTVSEVDVVAHADLVAVVEDGRPPEREEEPVHELDEPPVVAEERREAPPDPEVDPGLRVPGVHLVHVVALLVRHHLERELVVVPEERGPLARLGNLRRLLQDVQDRKTVLLLDRHEEPRHQREVERHVALIPLPHVRGGILRPLVRLREEHAAHELRVHVAPQLPEISVRLLQVLAARGLPLVEVRNGVQSQPIDSHGEPEIDHVEQSGSDIGAIEVEVRLVEVEAVPVVRFRDRVPCPVRGLEVLEDDAGFLVSIGRVAPHVEVALARAGRRPPRGLEPGGAVGGVVEDELRDDPEVPPVRLLQERLEVLDRAVRRVDGRVLGDVVAIVLERRGIEGQEPEHRDAEILQVIELLPEPPEVADAVRVRVEEGADVELVDDRVLVPEGIGGERALRGARVCAREGHGDRTASTSSAGTDRAAVASHTRRTSATLQAWATHPRGV